MRRALYVFCLSVSALFAQDRTPLSAGDLELYALHCAPCHGERGRGDGVAGRFLWPKPRNLRGPLAYGSHESERSSRADIVRTLKDGLAGTSMLAFEHLGEDALDRLAGVVLHFQSEGLIEALKDHIRGEDALKAALARAMDPGQKIAVPPAPANDLLSRARGGLLFAEACASCHGMGDLVRPREDLLDSFGQAIRPRPLNKGLFKWEREEADLFRLIRRGLPGHAMPGIPASLLPDEGVHDLVHYLRSTTPPAARASHTTKRLRVAVPYLPGAVPDRIDDPRFLAAARFATALAPFQADGLAPEALHLEVFHDGELIHLRARWADATRNPSDPTRALPPDGFAARVTNFQSPPILPIPGLPLPLDRALWLAGEMPQKDDPAYQRDGQPFENPDRVCKSPIGPERVGRARWTSNTWTLVLAVKPDRGGAVTRGGHLFASFSVFEGEHSRGPLPSAFTQWHRLDFE